MCIHSEARSYFGQRVIDDNFDVITNGYTFVNENLRLGELLKDLNSLNLETAVLENESAFIFKYLLIVDLSRRANLYKMEFPLHKPSLYISKYFSMVEENIDIFTKVSEIIHNNRFHKTGLFGAPDHPVIRQQLQDFVDEVKEPFLSILEKLKAGFQEQEFKLGIKAEQKYFSKMKLKYSELDQKMVNSSGKFIMKEFNLYSRDFSFDDYISGSICTINLDAVLDDLGSDRKLFIEMSRKEFSDDFLGCVWKLNHNLTHGFYFSFLFYMKKSKKVNNLERLQVFLNNSVYKNKNFKLIRSGSHSTFSTSYSDTAFSSASKYVIMDTIFNFKLENHKTLGCVGFKDFVKESPVIN